MIVIGGRNPGVYTVISKLFDIIELDERKEDIIINFMKDLIKKLVYVCGMFIKMKLKWTSKVY